MGGSRRKSDARKARRAFLSRLSWTTMGASLAAAYGTFAAFALRYLYPTKERLSSWQFVTEVRLLEAGDSIRFTAPSGATALITRRGEGETSRDFIALSDVCPHLGCRVHWEAHNGRFFCPCHNGAFNASGRATSGPPAEAKQSLPEYRLKTERGLLYIDAPGDALAMSTRPRLEGRVAQAAEKLNRRRA